MSPHNIIQKAKSGPVKIRRLVEQSDVQNSTCVQSPVFLKKILGCELLSTVGAIPHPEEGHVYCVSKQPSTPPYFVSWLLMCSSRRPGWLNVWVINSVMALDVSLQEARLAEHLGDE